MGMLQLYCIDWKGLSIYNASLGGSIILSDRYRSYWKIQGGTRANAGEIGWLETIEATVACVSALSIEGSGEREALLYIHFARGLQRMFFSFAIAGKVGESERAWK